ncbi:MAG: cytochrome c biogenesis protein ResB [Deltaproteobacteria bacterium]|nr:cytochrome c biogenesis protein ResB [Deltaproteobacteria bacterium]
MSIKKKSIGEHVFDFFASVRLSLILLAGVAAVSILGTLIPQGEEPEVYAQYLGPRLFDVFESLGFFDMYHAPWFLFILLLLALNLIGCSLKRFPKTMGILKAPIRLDEGVFKKEEFHYQIKLDAPLERVKTFLTDVVAKHYPNRPAQDDSPEKLMLYGEKGGLSRLGPYIIHTSVLLIFLGAFIGTRWGFEGRLTLSEGERSGVIRLKQTDMPKELGFSVKCDKFSVSFYENGMPKEYRTDLTVIEGGRVVEKAAIRVNDPFTYKGVTFYQSNYGTMGDNITLGVRPAAGGEEKIVKLDSHLETPIPGVGLVKLANFYPNLMKMGPAVKLAVAAGAEEPEAVVLFQKAPDFDKRRQGKSILTLKSFTERYYTGLQVNSDPGVWLVWLGCGIMVAGFLITFYVSHRRIYVLAQSQPDGTIITFSGRVNRNKLAFKRELDRLCQTVQANLQKAE